ncbi:MAG: hypothetical protein ACE5GB_10050 [Acidimicrobiales bacterium]
MVAAALLATACGGDVSAPPREFVDPAAVVAGQAQAPATDAGVDSDDGPLDPTQIPGDIINQYDLVSGECFDRIEDIRAGRRVVITTRLPCEGPHQFEVYHTLQFQAPHPAIHPGEDVMEDFALQACYAEFEPFVGRLYELSALEIGVFTPTRKNFEDDAARYRGIHCWVGMADGSELIGSAQGSGL